MREEFEKLDEVKWILELCEYDSERNIYDAKSAHCEFDEYHTNFVNGAWYAWQEQQKNEDKAFFKLARVKKLIANNPNKLESLLLKEIKELLK